MQFLNILCALVDRRDERGHISLLAGRMTRNTYHIGTRLLATTTITHTDKNGNTSTQTVSNPTYDIFGNVTANDRPGTAADMSYTYDTLHGWLKGVSSSCGFSEQLLCETASVAQLSGNIGSMLWRNTANGEQHRYDYTYDELGRLTSSQYSSSANGTEGRFDESVSYNSNGSITSLLRSGMKNDGTFGTIDDLTISYDGNRLLKVTDDAEAVNYNGALDFHDNADADSEYEYDSNGALTQDKNRGITSITYDYGHHPSTIRNTNERKTINNDYNSDGRKLRSSHVTFTPNGHGGYRHISIQDLYIDGLILRGGKPLLWQFDGGYVDLDANGAPTSWNYYITDHLGSTRMVVSSNESIREMINYYPFGSEMRMEVPAKMQQAEGSKHPFRFTGKELDKLNGLNMYDFGARLYDVAGVPMWTSVDPLAEKYYPFTPYSYCMGDPVNKIDPDGEKVFLYATTLPTDNKTLKLGGIPTHTFITVENSEGKVIRYAAYGPENGNPFMGFNQLKECHYQQDINVYKGIDTENLKCKIEVPVPKDMPSDEFDKSVVNTINSFGNEKGIRYDILPTNDIQGNCNTSSSTILLKSGVSKETVNQIKDQIPGIKTGFDSEPKPWTSEEQKGAIKDYHEDMCKKSTL